MNELQMYEATWGVAPGTQEMNGLSNTKTQRNCAYYCTLGGTVNESDPALYMYKQVTVMQMTSRQRKVSQL